VGTEIRTPVTGATSLDSNQLNYSHQGIAAISARCQSGISSVHIEQAQTVECAQHVVMQS